MDVELLSALRDSLSRPDRVIFLQKSYNILCKFGRGKGFRKSTWWNNPFCRALLADFFSHNEQGFKTTLPKLPDTIASSDKEQLLPEYKEISEYFHKTYGAPKFTYAEVQANKDSLFTEAFDRWFSANSSDPDVVRDFKERMPSVPVPDIVLSLFYEHGSQSTFAEFCHILWKKLSSNWQLDPDIRELRKTFPIPEDLKAQFDLPPDESEAPALEARAVETVEPAVEKTTPIVKAAEPASKTSEKAKRKGDENARPQVYIDAERFKTDRSPETCRTVIDALTDMGYFAAAAEYSHQLTYVAARSHMEEAFYVNLMATVRRDTYTPAFDGMVEAFKEDFPQSSHLKTLEADLKHESEAAQQFKGRLQIWTEPVKHWGATQKKQRRAVSLLLDVLAKRERLDGLEFAAGAVARFPEDLKLRRELLQLQIALGLTSAAANTCYHLVQRESSSIARQQVLLKWFDCLVADNRFDDMGEVLELLEKEKVSPAILERCRSQCTPTTEPTEAVEPPQEKPQVGAPVYPKNTESAPRTRPDVSEIPYPRRFIGFIRHRASYVNFFPVLIEADSEWYRLLPAEAQTLFPRLGGISLRFPNPAEALPFKEGRFVVITVERNGLQRTDDKDYEISIEPHYGQEARPMSTAAFVLVTPKDKDFDLCFDTEVLLDDEVGECPALDGESALIAVSAGYIGPFRLRATKQGQLYIPKQAIKDQVSVPLWKPHPESLVRITVSVGQKMVSCRLMSVIANQSEGTMDLIRDSALLRLAAKVIPPIPSSIDLSALTASEILSDAHRRERVRTLVGRLSQVSNFSTAVRDFSVDNLITALKAERPQPRHPITEAVVEAVTQSPELQQLAKKLTDERTALEEAHRQALAVENQRFEAQKSSLTQQLDQLKADIESTEAENQSKQAFWKTEFERLVNQAQTRITEHAVQPYLKNLPAEATLSTATEPVSDDTLTPVAEPDFKARAQAMCAVRDGKKVSAKDTRERLIREFQDRRGYTRDEVINLFVSLANQFLTIFSGEPGCGKTSVCGILADVLGLTGWEERLSAAPAWQNAAGYDRFLFVPVERGWTNKRDFLGYFNPLTQSFSSSDRRRYDAFRLLNEEARSDAVDVLPFVFLLDEANLSPMEYYWADFMSLCDGDSRLARTVQLGDDRLCRIPSHLRFLATVNNDDTTETLSPRLLDRAWIIRLPVPQFAAPKKEGSVDTPVTWGEFLAAFGAGTAEKDVPEMQPFYEHFRKIGINVSMRSRRAVAKFIAVSSPLLDGGRKKAVDYAVAQKLLPLIRSSGEEFEQWLEELKRLCEPYPVSQSTVDDILICGNHNLGFYQFF